MHNQTRQIHEHFLKEMKKRRFRQYIAMIPLTIVIIGGFLVKHEYLQIDDIELFGKIILAVVLVLLIFSLRNRRCAACNRYLGKRVNILHCKKCKRNLYYNNSFNTWYKYDDVSWHEGGDDFPDDLTAQNAATHIGMFLAWCILHGFESSQLKGEQNYNLTLLRERKITGGDFLRNYMDYKFSMDDLNEEGNEFASFYYNSDAIETDYLGDYNKVLGDKKDKEKSLYYVKDSRENYDKLEKQIDKRYKVFSKSHKRLQKKMNM